MRRIKGWMVAWFLGAWLGTNLPVLLAAQAARPLDQRSRSSDKRVHFGLGSETSAQLLEISWPGGIVQTLKHVRADQILQVDEPIEAADSKEFVKP